jgi:hypothetical protein
MWERGQRVEHKYFDRSGKVIGVHRNYSGGITKVIVMFDDTYTSTQFSKEVAKNSLRFRGIRGIRGGEHGSRQAQGSSLRT